jgi:hypothetical protein
VKLVSIDDVRRLLMNYIGNDEEVVTNYPKSNLKRKKSLDLRY